MKQILVIMSLVSMFLGNNNPSNENIRVLSPLEFKSHVQDKDVQLVDVRTPREFNQGHIEGSINIDFYSGKFNEEFNKLVKDKAVYVYCRSGKRSRYSSNKIAALGFTEIYDLQGGILNYN